MRDKTVFNKKMPDSALWWWNQLPQNGDWILRSSIDKGWQLGIGWLSKYNLIEFEFRGEDPMNQVQWMRRKTIQDIQAEINFTEK